MAFLSNDELRCFGFKSVGDNVKISDKASIYNQANIVIGSNVRIDDFCILSAGHSGIVIGNYVHISCYVSLIGKERIVIDDFVAISARCSIYSSSDDYSGNFMTNPTVPEEFTNVHHAPVLINKHVIVGAGTLILPGVIIGQGAAIGAMSLVKHDVNAFSMNAGVPLRLIKDRSKSLLDLEAKFIDGH